MTTSAHTSSRPSRTLQRWLGWWQGFILSGDVLIFFVTAIMLAVPALSLNQAGWPLDLQTVLPAVALSVGFGFVLARSQYGELFAIIVNAMYGVVFISLLAAFNEPLPLLEALASVVQRSLQWLVDVFTGGINQDNLVFTLMASMIFWLLGHNAAWFIFREDRVWRVIMPPGLIVLTNFIFYSGDADLERYLVIFVFSALLLVVRSHLDAREYEWYLKNMRMPFRVRWQFIGSGAVMALVALTIAWLVPLGDLQERLDRFQEFLNNEPIRQMAEFWSRIIQPLESDGPITTDYYSGDSLDLSGAIRLGDQVVFLVSAPPENRYYWRARVFERYSNGRWSPSATLRVPDLQPPLEIITDAEVMGGARVAVSQTFTIANAGTRLIHTAPQPDTISVPGRIDLSFTRENVQPQPMNVSVIRPARVLERGMTYQAISQMSVATAFDLRQAGTNYPEWVVNPNTFVGNTVSPRVIQLAREIVNSAGAVNPYDQAKAIEQWLRTNITYNERITAPPASVDPLEWFLFEVREGYCTYYASAMVNLLRALGIPARMAAGFSQGEWDPALNQYVVRERDAHTWVEVYFPGYGWIEFEPTAAEMPLNRDGDSSPVPEELAPPPTAEPTITPTPEPSPTMPPTPTPDPGNPLSPDTVPTITLTPSPTPTTTPVIIPTIAPPIQPPPPPSDDFLSFLLPAIGAALFLLILVVVLVLALVFIYWWWEWRGVGGLSPIARAYTRLERYIRLIGVRTQPQQTPEEKRHTIVRRLPSAERPVTAITRIYTAERYSPPRPDSPASQRNAELAESAWPDARGRILRRWLRRFIPFIRKD